MSYNHKIFQLSDKIGPICCIFLQQGQSKASGNRVIDEEKLWCVINLIILLLSSTDGSQFISQYNLVSSFSSLMCFNSFLGSYGFGLCDRPEQDVA